MNSNKLNNGTVRKAGVGKRSVLEVNEFRDQMLSVSAVLQPSGQLRKVRLVYALPTIGTGKSEVYLDEANLVAVVE
jgi:hypothetical protein